MEDLKGWMEQKITNKEVEPNSGLGAAIKYELKHWKELTLFLRMPGSPIDNNVCERILKAAIRHRDNSLFYEKSPFRLNLEPARPRATVARAATMDRKTVTGGNGFLQRQNPSLAGGSVSSWLRIFSMRTWVTPSAA